MQKPKKPNLPRKSVFLNPIQSQNGVIQALNELRLFNLWLYHGNTPETFDIDKAQKLEHQLSREYTEKRNAIIAKYESELAKYEKEKAEANVSAFERYFDFFYFDGVTYVQKKWNEKISHEEKGKFGEVLFKVTATPRELLRVKGTHDAIASLPDVREDRQQFKKQAFDLYDGCLFDIEIFKDVGSHRFECMLKFRV
jgi:hypothetical protein